MTLRVPDNQTIVIFGATGDLTGRKLMPALYNLFVESLLPEDFAVVGYSRTPMSNEEFREHQAANVAKYSRTGLDPEAWEHFATHVDYIAGGFEPEGAMHSLAQRLEEIDAAIHGGGRRMFYCAVPPSLFPKIASRLGEEGLNRGGRIVMEKPFGFDLASAQELNRQLHEVFDENQIYRIDHYLGKETVQNILVLRFANGMFEPIWNRRYVKQVQIDVAEELGIEGRGRFYEEAGAMRDIVQNHIMQLLAFVTMEPPARFDAESIRDEKVKLLRSVPPVRRRERDVVRGQYVAGVVRGVLVPGYREEIDVAPDSITETFVAIRMRVENWRWAGVPNEGISLSFDAKVPGPEMRLGQVQMDFEYEKSFMTKPAEAYERLLHDVMVEDHTLFMRADEIERAWEIVEPVLERLPPDPYFSGSWGPERAKELVAPYQWHLR